MSDETLLDRIENRQESMYKLFIEQTKKNGEYDSHLRNHSKCNKVLGWVVGVVISLGFFKGLGG